MNQNISTELSLNIFPKNANPKMQQSQADLKNVKQIFGYIKKSRIRNLKTNGRKRPSKIYLKKCNESRLDWKKKYQRLVQNYLRNEK